MRSRAKDAPSDDCTNKINAKLTEEDGENINEADMNPLDDDDEIIAEDEIQAPDAPPPPALAEDLDGNWQGPVRQRVRALPKPVTPTRAERERHRLTHIPFADWCVHCVRCKGRNLPHRRVEPLPEAGTVPVVSMDLAFIKRSDADQAVPLIVTRDRRSPNGVPPVSYPPAQLNTIGTRGPAGGQK